MCLFSRLKSSDNEHLGAIFFLKGKLPYTKKYPLMTATVSLAPGDCFLKFALLVAEYSLLNSFVPSFDCQQ